MRRQYDEDLSPEENTAIALFEIASAIKDVARALSYAGGEGMSVSEAITVGAEHLAAELGRDDE